MSDSLRIGLLHLRQSVGDVPSNARLVEQGILVAVAMGAQWIVTPELCLTGYDFRPYIGVDWIEPPDRDAWFNRFRGYAVQHGVTLFFAHPERDDAAARLYNTLFVIGPDGTILGRHRKRNVTPAVEDWSTRGEDTSPVVVGGLRVGLLVCADSYTAEPARGLAAAGAEILISSASWCPQPHGPDGCWERRSEETGLPLLVCNRTGKDRVLDFSDSETTVVHRGERLLTYQGTESAVVVVEWNLSDARIVRHSIRPLNLPA